MTERDESRITPYVADDGEVFQFMPLPGDPLPEVIRRPIPPSKVKWREPDEYPEDEPLMATKEYRRVRA